MKIYYRKYEEVIKYLIIGLLTTVVSLSTYNLLTVSLLDPGKPFELQVANVITWIIAVTFAYFANRIIVFKSRNEKKLKEATKFYSARVITLLMDMLIMFILVTSLSVNDRVAKLIVQIVVTILNYIFSKFIVFKK